MNLSKSALSFLLLSHTTFATAPPPLDNCETPSSISCIYGLTPPVTGCPTATTTVNPAGGHGAIAVVEALDNPNAQSDLNTFSTQFNLPATTLSIIYAPAAPSNQPLSTGCTSLLPVGGAPADCTTDVTPNNDPCDEHVADIEWAHAMAPSAAIIMVEAPSNNIWDKMYAVCYAARAVSQAGGGMVSMSWSTAEFPEETGYDKYFQLYPNVIFVGSAGDHSAPANYPSASPYVISAGGTSLNRNAQGNFVNETAWGTDSTVPAGNKNGGSGGPSLYEPRPIYQNAVMKIVGNTRGTPDISFDANPKTGVCVYSSLHQPTPGWFRDGGTSIAAPSLAGILNVANHQTNTTDELNYIYLHALKNYHSNWHDILIGNNGYPALAGYDFTTGLGSPLGYGGK